jgi:hypothetical protein
MDISHLTAYIVLSTRTTTPVEVVSQKRRIRCVADETGTGMDQSKSYACYYMARLNKLIYTMHISLVVAYFLLSCTQQFETPVPPKTPKHGQINPSSQVIFLGILIPSLSTQTGSRGQPKHPPARRSCGNAEVGGCCRRSGRACRGARARASSRRCRMCCP